MTLPWSKATGVSIGVDWLLAAIAPASAYGRRARERERAFRRGDEAAARDALERVATAAREADASQLAAIARAIVAAPEILTALERARSGGTLADTDFFELGRFLDALSGAIATTQAIPSFAAFTALHGCEALRTALEPGRTRDRTFYLADAFDAALGDERERMRVAQVDLDVARSRAHAEVAEELGLPSIRDGEFTIARERAQELPPSVRIVREGATYLLCRLEPEDDELFALEQRDEAADAVAETEEDVRARLTTIVAASASEIDAARTALGELDALVARAAFVKRYDCIVPEICDEPAASLTDARYLPLDEDLRQSGRTYAPLTFELEGVAVVTGPNMGGKTAALRTLGFAAACVSLGVPVPARAARLPLVETIAWLGLDESPSESALLSSFGREVVAVRDALATGGSRTLVLVDEFARTTSPREGRALTVALVRAFIARKALGLVATHFTDVAGDAEAPHFASGRLGTLPPADGERSLEAALGRIASAMDYGLVRVGPGDAPSADALALAEALGLEPAIVADARSRL
jgi:hypothetical protein